MRYREILTLLLFELGFGVKLNFIGVISISELFLMLFVPLFILPKVKWRKTNELRRLTIAYVLLFVSQVISEFIVGNDISSSFKGLAITVVSYFHFMFLCFYLSRQKSLILVLIISQIMMKLLFGTDVAEQSVEDMLQGEGATYLKFYIAPLLISIFLAVSIIFKHKSLSVIFSLLGVLLVFLGARSSGGLALLAGLVAYMLEHKIFTFDKKVLVLSTVVLCVIAYSFYAYYVSSVLAGDITSGNSQQVFLCENPYNPLELLIAGRSEAWVGWQAFMDKFWFGHGAWPYDTTGRYQRMMLAMHDELSTISRNQISFHYLIPSHSVLIGSGMMNGIFAFLAMGYIVFYFLWKGVSAFVKCDNRYKLVLIYNVFNLFSITLFAPQSHFRQTMPVAFAIIFVLSMSNGKEKLSLAKSRLSAYRENMMGLLRRRK